MVERQFSQTLGGAEGQADIATMTHVPAWKRLGLRLKYADENVPPVKCSANIKAPTRTRTRSPLAAEDPAQRSSPKRRPSSDGHSPIKHSTPPPNGSPTGKRKSVTFTPETKAEDGEGIKQIYRRWIISSLQEDPHLDPDTLPPALKTAYAELSHIDDRPDAVDDKVSKLDLPLEERREAKRKRKLERKSVAATPNDDPHLVYLTNYHKSPSTWKFSKTHQNHLLKHALSLRHLPSSYDAVLQHYLQGLQGAKARERLRRMALALRAEDDETSASEYRTSVDQLRARVDDQSEDLSRDCAGEGRLQKRRRAEIILNALGEEETKVFAEPTIHESRLSQVPTDSQQTSKELADPNRWQASEEQPHTNRWPATKESRSAPAEPEIDGVKGAVQVKVNGGWMLGRDAAKLNGTIGIAPKKIVFDGAESAPQTESKSRIQTGSHSKPQKSAATLSSQPKQKRKQGRKRRSKRTAPDSEESSSSSSDSSPDSSDREPSGPDQTEAQIAHNLLRQEAAQRIAMARSMGPSP